MVQQSDEACPACGAPSGTATVNHLGFRLRDCQACGLWSWDNRQPADYDAVYSTAEYEATQIAPLKNESDPKVFLHHPTYALFFREVPRVAGGSLLDVGCGVGRFLLAARSVGWATRGIDISQTAVAIGRNDAALELSCQTIEQLSAAGARFDAVTAFEVLEHVPQPVELVQSAMSLLKEGGWFFCTVPNRESPTVQKTQRPDWLPPVHLQFFTQQALQTLLQRAGGNSVRTGLIVIRPQRFIGKVKHLVKRLIGRKPGDPLGIWGMAQRELTSRR